MTGEDHSSMDDDSPTDGLSSASTDPRRVGWRQRRRLSEKRWRGWPV